MSRSYEHIIEVLKTKEKYVAEDGSLLKAIVYQDVMRMDTDLLHLLLSDEELKATFFTAINETLVFDKRQFAWLIQSREFLPDSFTTFTNKIGLTTGGHFFSTMDDVVLDFPYKDAVLAGGQEKEDKKRNEIVFNEILAKDQITNLLAPKVLTKARRYMIDGVNDDIVFTEEDNLVIKGNNLIALSSLLERYEGEVKMIYIDPPYYFKETTATDTFRYNSNFKLSTWLLFMRNRLKLAKDLLAPSGTIWINISEDGMHYLKVMADDIFGADHFVGTIPRRTRSGKSDVPFNLSQDFDWILVYTHVGDEEKVIGRTVERKYYETEDFPGRPWRLADLTKQTTAKERPNSFFTMVDPKTGKEYPASEKRTWNISVDTFQFYYDRGEIVFPDDYPFLNITKPYARKFKDNDEAKGKLSAVISDFQIQDFLKDVLNNSKNAGGNSQIDALLGRDEFDYAKPENLIKAILEVATNENDLVMDFFLGSGTTAAVAHKMNRRYIGIEQMHYINTVTVPRLQKVIEGEQGGISNIVNWQGGGSFVFCELLEDGARYIGDIEQATEETIDNLKEEIYGDERIVPYLTTAELQEVEADFQSLTLPDKKRALIGLIDKNKLYVNYSSIDDEEYAISEKDRVFTESFYKGGQA